MHSKTRSSFAWPFKGSVVPFAPLCSVTTVVSIDVPVPSYVTITKPRTSFGRPMPTLSAILPTSVASPVWPLGSHASPSTKRSGGFAVSDRRSNWQHSILRSPAKPTNSDPERTAAQREIRRLIEGAIDDLPELFRVVFVMRDIEDMSVEETADFLGLRPATVKTRLHRARRLLRKALDAQLASTLTDAFPFDGMRCARMTNAILQRFGFSPLSDQVNNSAARRSPSPL
jgi:RNA polymerase sigma factor (sigma-70 family)